MVISLIQNMQRYMGYPVSRSYDVTKGDWLVNTIINKLSYSIEPILLSNIFVVISIILSLAASYLLFYKITGQKIITVLFSLMYSFCNYYLYRVLSLTVSLYFIFGFPFLLYLLITKVRAWKVSLFLIFYSLISTYYGFFSILLVPVWYLSELIVNLSKSTINDFIKKLLEFGIPLIFFLGLFYNSLIIKNIPILSSYTRPTTEQDLTGSGGIYRPIEDFYNLSLRPWYFVIPPKSSSNWGVLSENLHSSLSESNYYLAKTFMEEEMGGAYLGWHLVIGHAFVLLLLAFKIKKYPIINEKKDLLIKLNILLLFILLISMAPSFTISGVTIYTPSYLLYYLFPMFRVLSRWAVVIVLLNLVVNAVLVTAILPTIKKNTLRYLFISLLTFTHGFLLFINLPVISVNNLPKEIEYLYKISTDTPIKYAIFPRATYDDAFWSVPPANLLFNAPGTINSSIGFFGDNPLNIDTQGLMELKDNGVRILIYKKDNYSGKDYVELNKTIGISDPSKIQQYLSENLKYIGEVNSTVYFEIIND